MGLHHHYAVGIGGPQPEKGISLSLRLSHFNNLPHRGIFNYLLLPARPLDLHAPHAPSRPSPKYNRLSCADW